MPAEACAATGTGAGTCAGAGAGTGTGVGAGAGAALQSDWNNILLGTLHRQCAVLKYVSRFDGGLFEVRVRPSISEVEKSEGVDTVVGDQCLYGLTAPNADRTAMAPA